MEFPEENALNDLILRHRSLKSGEEYQIMQRAQDITDRCYAQLLNFIREGVTEMEIVHELSRLIKAFGSQGESFETIAVGGENGSMPHGEPTERPRRAGDFLTLDFGVKLDGYCSDMTRTLAIGHVSDEQRHIYETVLRAQNAAFEAVAVGAPCSAVDEAARGVIGAAGVEKQFGHATGHALGLEIHEGPRFSPRETAAIEAGLVMSVEPGIYLEGRCGCRIEDVIYVTKDGFVNLTASPKELLVL